MNSWFETSNKCPYCREEVYSFWYKGEEIKVEPKRPDSSDEDDDSYQEEQELDYICYNCENT